MNNKNNRRSGRRTILKTVGASVVGLGVGTSMTSAKSGFSADFGEPLDPSEYTVTSGIISRSVSGDVKAVTNHWGLLAHDHDATREYLRKSNLSGSELGHTLSFMNEFWKDFPVTEVSEDGEIRITLDDDAKSPSTITRDDRSRINKAASAVHNGMASIRGVNAEWAPATHRSLTAEAGQQLNLASTYVDTIRKHADDPDFWSCDGCVQSALQAVGFGWIPTDAQNALADALNQVMHSYTHYYNPDLKWCYDGVCYHIGAFGGAPSETKHYLDKAKNQVYLDDAFKQMSFAGHYISDCGQPLHTSLEYKQYQNQWVHYDYETFVNNNWDTGENFKANFANTSSYYPINSASQAAKDIAGESNKDAWNLYDTIYSNPYSWKTSTTIDSITSAAMERVGLYVRGYIKEVQNAF